MKHIFNNLTLTFFILLGQEQRVYENHIKVGQSKQDKSI